MIWKEERSQVCCICNDCGQVQLVGVIQLAGTLGVMIECFSQSHSLYHVAK